MSSVAAKVEWGFHLPSSNYATEAFHDLGVRLMDELIEIEDRDASFSDSTVSTNADEGTLVAELLIKHVAFVQAVGAAPTAIGAAVRTTGGPLAEDLVPSELTVRRVVLPGE